MYYEQPGGGGKLWKLLQKVELPGNPEKNLPPQFEYALTDESRRIMMVSEKDFLGGYVSALPFYGIPPDPIKETLSNIRAHSTIRFAALPFFLGAFAVLAKAFYDAAIPTNLIIAVAAVGLSLVAVVFEVVLSRNLIAWWRAIAEKVDEPTSGWWIVGAHRNRTALGAARMVLFLPYPTAFAFWMFHVLENWMTLGCWGNMCAVQLPPAAAWGGAALTFVAGGVLAAVAWWNVRVESEWYKE